MDVGILILRVVVGLALAAHGAQKLFGIFGGGGISRTSQFMESLGFRPGRFFAYLLGIVELSAGAMFASGLFTPVAAVAIIGTMTAASVAVHWKNGFFATDGGFELPFLIAVVAAAVAFTGPGYYSWDAWLELPVKGTQLSLSAIGLGVLGGLAVAGIRNLPERVPFRRTQVQG